MKGASVFRIASICSATFSIDHVAPVHTSRFSDKGLRHTAGYGDQHLARDRTGFMGKPSHHGRYHLRRHRGVGARVQSLGHSRHRRGNDDVALHALRGTLKRDDIGQSDYARLASAKKSKSMTSRSVRNYAGGSSYSDKEVWLTASARPLHLDAFLNTFAG